MSTHGGTPTGMDGLRGGPVGGGASAPDPRLAEMERRLELAASPHLKAPDSTSKMKSDSCWRLILERETE